MAGYAGDGLESLFRMWIVESSRHWLRGDCRVLHSKGPKTTDPLEYCATRITYLLLQRSERRNVTWMIRVNALSPTLPIWADILPYGVQVFRWIPCQRQ